MRTTFPACDGARPDADAQAALCLGSAGFRLWTKTGRLDVAAAGERQRFKSEKSLLTFPIAVKTDKIETITIDGKTRFRSLKGTCTGFLSPSGQIGVCDPVVFIQTAGLVSAT